MIIIICIVIALAISHLVSHFLINKGMNRKNSTYRYTVLTSLVITLIPLLILSIGTFRQGYNFSSSYVDEMHQIVTISIDNESTGRTEVTTTDGLDLVSHHVVIDHTIARDPMVIVRSFHHSELRKIMYPWSQDNYMIKILR